MFESIRKTFFASAERKEKHPVVSQAKDLQKELKEQNVLNMMPDPVAILNKERQIIFANNSLLETLNLEDESSILGASPGEVLKCVNADNDSGSCGTTKFCKVCGAINSILDTQKSHLSQSRECEIMTTSGSACNLRVWTFPFEKNGEKFVLLIIRNIANEVFMNSMERIFFHDLANIGSCLFGLLNMINSQADYSNNHPLLLQLTEELLEEISAQRDILQAEQGNMPVNWKTVNNMEIIDFAVAALKNHKISRDKTIETTDECEEVVFTTDERLLKRIIVNMVKNALEASSPEDTVTLNSRRNGDNIIFEVHNSYFIPEDTQLRIFNRAFSTKGKGRGLGTYSMKLLSENYLQSKVYFTSTPDGGTSFFLECPITPTTKKK